MNKHLTGVLERVEHWPEVDQQELLEYALEVEARHQVSYRASPEELAGIDRGLKDAEAGRLVSEADVEAALAKFRGR